MTEVPYERQIIDVKGNLRWILWQDTPGLNNTLIGVGQDITERKMSEQRLLARNAVARALAECATLEEAARRILQSLCECLDWQAPRV